MEKFIDLHIRSKYLVRHRKEVALSAFVDIQGAFDNTGYKGGCRK
jgi:hypothetical protein